MRTFLASAVLLLALMGLTLSACASTATTTETASDTTASGTASNDAATSDSLDGDSMEMASDSMDHDDAGPGDDHGDDHGEGHEGGHAHGGTTEVDWSPVPTLALTVTADPAGGWDVEALTENFTIVETDSTDPVAGEGHMHIYVNGAKLGRLYSEQSRLEELPAGDVEIKVELNGHDHSALSIDGEAIAATQIVTVSADQATAPAPAPTEAAINVTYADGEVTVEEQRFEFNRGDLVTVSFTTDVAEEIHVHGYDLHLYGQPGETAYLEFEATIPGLLEVELENTGTFAFELQVN